MFRPKRPPTAAKKPVGVSNCFSPLVCGSRPVSQRSHRSRHVIHYSNDKMPAFASVSRVSNPAYAPVVCCATASQSAKKGGQRRSPLQKNILPARRQCGTALQAVERDGRRRKDGSDLFVNMQLRATSLCSPRRLAKPSHFGVPTTPFQSPKKAVKGGLHFRESHDLLRPFGNHPSPLVWRDAAPHAPFAIIMR
jgi:hypothetical protein